jgi:hypothetical protein
MLGRVVVLFLLAESRCVPVASLLTNPVLLAIHNPPERASFSTQISVLSSHRQIKPHPPSFIEMGDDH